MAPDANPVIVTHASSVNTPNSELEDALHYQSLSFTEPISCSRDGHDAANDLADTKTCFLEESLLFDYNPTLDTSSVYSDIPADDRGTSSAVLKHPATNGDIGQWPFEMATPTVVGEASSNTMPQDKQHGIQSKQANSDWEFSTLSAAFRVPKIPAGDIKDPPSDLVDSAALDRSGKGPVLVVHSTIVLPPIAMAAVPTKEKGIAKRNPTDQRCIPKHKPYRDMDILMGRGGNATYHPGNKRYLVAMKRRLVQYHNSERSEKIKVSQQVVDEVHGWGGRFLKRVKGSSEYFEVSNKIARTRVSQALRDGKAFE
jgi:hypothetical protein